MSENQVALITGVSSGIGREVAQLLAQRGGRVFGTVRDLSRAEVFPGVELVHMDVTDDVTVADGVESVLRRAGHIDVLINSAGYALSGALEETSIEEARRQFETNFFGVLRVTQAVLPSMRHQGHGRIVNISSVLGFVPGPYRGIYAATKHALEAYTETLDYEVRGFGVRAVLIEPGFTKTAIDQNTRHTARGLAAYARQRQQVELTIQRETDTGADPRGVAEAVYRAIEATSPRLRYPTGKGVLLSRLRRFLPAGMFDMGLRRQFRMDDIAIPDATVELAKGKPAR